jgi:DNA-binding ferritin-like protein
MGIVSHRSMERAEKLANLFTATLRAIYLVHQFSHWTTKGLGAYGNHLLFERLYKSAGEDADLIAEHFIGILGENTMDFKSQQEYLSQILAKYQDHAMEKLQLGLAIERDFVAFAKQAYVEFDKSEGILTLGLDNDIQQVSSNAESRIYLLQQALDEEPNE